LTTAAYFIDLPSFSFPDQLISRPVDFVTSILFFIALLFFIRLYYKEKDYLLYWFILSIVFNTTGQFIISFSKLSFDIYFDIAHIYKVLGYVMPGIGLGYYLVKTIVKISESEEKLKEEVYERSLTEEKLQEISHSAQESEQRLLSIFENIVDGIFVINRDKKIESVNPAALKLFGYKQNELIGQNIKMITPEPHRSQHDDYIDNYLKTGKAKIIGLSRELSAIKKDDSEFPIFLAISEIVVEDNIKFIGIIKDITERVENEKFLAKEKERLAKSLAQIEFQNKELSLINEELRTLDELKTNFVSTVSHELWTPFTSIKGSLGLLLAGSVGEISEQTRDFLDISHRNTDRLI